MKLQTEIPLKKGSFPINYNSKIVLLGSCFASNIGNQLKKYRFQAVQNPFGTLFHPLVIAALFERAVKKDYFTKEDCFLNGESWYSYHVHSSLNAPSNDELVTLLNTKLDLLRTVVLEASHIVITLGTAWGYRLKKTADLVANCHKQPQKNFSKELLTVEEVSQYLQFVQHLLKEVNPSATLLFTVSPIRHIKDGIVENQRSKSHLIAGVHQALEESSLTETIPSFYFPAYELLMDELRDYRFYAADLIHPNEMGIQYVWEKFIKTWVSETALGTMKKVEEIQKGLQHKPFHPQSKAHQKFRKSLEAKISKLQEQYPFMYFSE